MKSARTKSKGANLPVPQNRDEAAQSLARIGILMREVKRIELKLSDRVSKLKEEAEAQARPLSDEIEAVKEGLRIWSEANRAALTNDNKVKFAHLGTGTISWRFRPAKVTIRSLEEVIAVIKARALPFLRVKEEVNKEAMLSDRGLAASIPGVTIGSDGEDFIAEPIEVAIEGQTSAEAA